MTAPDFVPTLKTCLQKKRPGCLFFFMQFLPVDYPVSLLYKINLAGLFVYIF
jgi:hypothetical protein